MFVAAAAREGDVATALCRRAVANHAIGLSTSIKLLQDLLHPIGQGREVVPGLPPGVVAQKSKQVLLLLGRGEQSKAARRALDPRTRCRLEGDRQARAVRNKPACRVKDRAAAALSEVLSGILWHDSLAILCRSSRLP